MASTPIATRSRQSSFSAGARADDLAVPEARFFAAGCAVCGGAAREAGAAGAASTRATSVQAEMVAITPEREESRPRVQAHDLRGAEEAQIAVTRAFWL
jgi:hypothetical protein